MSSRKKTLFIIPIFSLFLCGFVFVGHNSTKKTSDLPIAAANQEYSSWPIDKYYPVPFTDFSTENHTIALEFKADTKSARLIKDGSIWLNLPANLIPIKVLEGGDNRFFIFSRKLFSGELSIHIVNNGRETSFPFPKELSDFIFKNAAILNNEIIAVLYNPYTDLNYLYTWKINPDSTVTLRKEYIRELSAETPERDAVFRLAIGKDPSSNFQALYIVKRSDYFIYSNSQKPTLEHYSIENVGLDNIDLASDGKTVTALFMSNSLDEVVDENNQVSYFKLYDLTSRLLIREGQLWSVPKKLDKNTALRTIDFAETKSQIIMDFSARLIDMPQSGIMEIGGNNYDGLVTESQLFYLSGFIDLLASWPGMDLKSEEFINLQKQIKLRLDLEVFMLDRLLDDDQPGMQSKNRSIDRMPVTIISDEAKLLSLFSIYLRDIPNPIEIMNLKKLEHRVVTLEGSINEIALSEEADSGIPVGYPFIRYLKNSPAILDGANISYSDQNSWVNAVTLIPADRIGENTVMTALKMVDVFMKTVTGNDQLPEDYNWRSSFGYSAYGWIKEDGISVNTSEYDGDLSFADIKQKSADMEALVSVGLVQPSLLPDNTSDYIKQGVASGALLPKINKDFFRLYTELPEISNRKLEKNYYLSPSNWEVQKRVWGFIFLLCDAPDKPTVRGLYPGSAEYITGIESNDIIHISDKDGFISKNGDLNRVYFFLSLIILFLSSIFISAKFRITILPAFFLAVVLIVIAQIVLIFEFLSFFNKVNSRGFFLIAELCILMISVGIWVKNKKPDPFLYKITRRWLFDEVSALYKSLIKFPLLWVLGFGVSAAFFYALYTGIIFPQNYDDVLTTHFARIGFWLQSGTFYPWEVSTYNLPQVISPSNSQLLILWTFLMYGGDQLAALPQWSAGIIAIVSIYGLGRTINLTRPRAIFGALLFVTMPVTAMQLSTSLTDLLSTALFASGLYFLFFGWKHNNRGYLILSTLAIALCIGTKQTVFFAAPGLLISLFLLFYYLPENRFRKIGTLLISGLIFFLLVGSYAYIQNYLVFGKFLGPEEVADAYTRAGNISILGRLFMAVDNVIIYSIYSFLSIIHPILSDTGILNYSLYGIIDFRISDMTLLEESVGTPGPVGFVIVFILLLSIFVRWKREKDPIIFSLVIIGSIYAIVLFVIRKYSDALYRYLLISFAVFFPLIGRLKWGYFDDSCRRKLKTHLLFGFVTISSLVIMIYSMAFDGAKPLKNILDPGSLDRIDKQTLLFDEFSQELKEVEVNVPKDASLGLILPEKFPISPMFGKYYTRYLIQMVPEKDGRVDWIKYSDVEYLLVDGNLFSKGFIVPEGLKRLNNGPRYILYQRTETSGVAK